MTQASSSPLPTAFAARLGIVGFSLLIHLASWVVPALRFDTTSTGPWVPRGWEVAFLGWQALLVGNAGWLANLLYSPSLVFVLPGWWRTAAALAAVAAAVGLHALAMIGMQVPADEGNVTQMVLVELRAGFYLWMASMVVVIAASLWCRRREAS